MSKQQSLFYDACAIRMDRQSVFCMVHLQMQLCVIIGLVTVVFVTLFSAASLYDHVPMERPLWCSRLLNHQKVSNEYACVAAFMNIGATAGVNLHVSRDKLLETIGGTTLSTPNWMGSVGQDWWVWYNHARFLNRKGVYIDLASNDPIWRSNTYFFDACMGWKGVCIEASSMHFHRIKGERTCQLVRSCISDSPNRTIRFNDGAGFHGGASAVLMNGSLAPQQHLRGRVKSMQCKTLQYVINRHRLNHIDFLSLDIEGHEVHALSTVDFARVKIDIIISENAQVSDILFSQGYRKHNTSKFFGDSIFLRSGFQLEIERRGQLAADWYNMRRCHNGKCDSKSKSCWWGY